MVTSADYAELHCLSNFTFLRGASHAEELVARAAQLGYHAIAITDECSVAGVVRAHVAARENHIALIIGSEFYLDDGLHLVLLATSRRGYGALSDLITRGRRAAAKGEYLLRRVDVANGLTDCLAIWLPGDDPDTDALAWLANVFAANLWIGVELLAGSDDAARLAQLLELSEQSGVPAVACGDVHMHVRGRRALQDTLTAIRLRSTVAEAVASLYPNGERHLRTRAQLSRLYPPPLLAATVGIADRCHFSLDELRYEYPQELVPAGETAASYLRKLTRQGMVRRWPEGVTDKVQAMIEHELTLISEMHYEQYFLTVHEIVEFARDRDILCQGRGSAANSAVCFCLGITEVDPARMSMLFERFISRERNEPPDIDVDFEHERREEVIQHLYEKYGRDRAALTATVISYRARSAIRDVAKAMGLDALQVDRITRALGWWEGDVNDERIRDAGFDPASPVIHRVLTLARQIMRFPRHLSQHVGGFVISKGPLSQLVPVENATMPDRTVIQWDKDDLDTLGLLKVDVLGLGMLSAIRRSFDLIRDFRQRDWTLATVPAEDSTTYDMISRGETMGVFQIESRAQMAMLPRLRPRCYYDLVIEVAIIRPGPIQGDMVHPYLRRRNGEEAVTYPSEDVRDVLSRTLGVPIFQEQVMSLAMIAAGFSAGEADQLRRAMAAWRRRGGLGPFEQRLKDGMRERGYTEAFADQIFRQIQGFGEYGFPESHAASFALLVYVSAWLKCHEPAAFVCALINSQPMGFYAPSQLVQDLRRHDVTVRAIDVTRSQWDCTLERVDEEGVHSTPRRDAPVSAKHKGSVTAKHRDAGVTHLTRNNGSDVMGNPAPGSAKRNASVTAKHHDAEVAHLTHNDGSDVMGNPSDNGCTDADPVLRLGLRLVKGLSEAAVQRLIASRDVRAFRDVQDLARRGQLDRAELGALAAAGALASLTGNRHRARWDVAGVEDALPLMPEVEIREAAPMLRLPSEGEDVIADYLSTGLTLGRHPMALLREDLDKQHVVTAAQLWELPDGVPVSTAGLVITRQRPGTAKGVTFVTLEDETGYINLVVWEATAERQRRILLGARLLGVRGQLQRQGDVLHVIVRYLQDHSALLATLPTVSRDFR